MPKSSVYQVLGREDHVAMDALQRILSLPETERVRRGLLHTPAEIAQQPQTWPTTARILREHAADLREFLGRAGVGGSTAERPVVFLVGAGTSDYIGRSVATLLRRRWACDAFAVPSTELLTTMDDVSSDRPRLWISFSRSGESSEGVAVLERALERLPDVKHLIVTCNANGRMAREVSGENVFTVALDDAVNDRGLAMTSSFTNMVVAGQWLAHAYEPDTYEPILERLVDAGTALLPRAADLAERLVDAGFSKACFLGTGALAGAAAESALKLLELSAGRVTTYSESFLGVRHGPLSAVDRDTLLVGFVSSGARRRGYETDLLDEVRDKRLAKSIVEVGAGETSGTESLALPGLGAESDDYRPVVDVIVAQLLGLFASLRLGLTPDAPSPTGAIRRVVSQVRIH